MTPSRLAPVARTLISASLLLAAACGGSDSPTDSGPGVQQPTVASVVILTAPGDQTVGASVSIDVRVDNTAGQPMASTAVTFSASAGSVSPSSATTSASGTASVTWTVGTSAGSQTLTATASGKSATVTVTAVPGPAAAFSKVSGDAQTGAAGEQLEEPLVVMVADGFGNAVAGESVTVAVTGGGGSVASETATTGSDGRASIPWILGEDLGENTLTATHTLGAHDFTATARAGAPATVTALSGDGQTGPAGTALGAGLVVEVKDRLGHLVPETPVVFTVGDGSGSVSADTVSTDAQGQAQTQWTLGGKAGTQTVEAKAGDAPAATFTATAEAGPAAKLQAVSGDAQDGTVGAALAQAVVVEVLDAFDNPVMGTTVTFTTTDADAATDPASVASGADGRAGTTWTLGTVAGAQSLAVSADGLTALSFAATAAPGAPAEVVAVSGGGQTGTVGQTLGSPLVARVADAFGNVVPGVDVTFTPSSGSVDPTSGQTGADGTVSTQWTLGTTSGSPTLEAAATGATSATFTATAAPGAAESFAAVSGDAQSGPAQSPLAAPLVVVARDGFGNGVPGVAVTFAVTEGGGSVSPASVNTGDDGTASSTFTLGATVGDHKAQASAGTLGTVDFTATATSGPPASMGKPSGDTQTRTVGDTLTVTVEVEDAFGNKVPNAAVVFTVATGGGSVVTPAPAAAAGPFAASEVTGATNASGLATALWTLGTGSGTQTLNASVSGAGQVTFTATGTAGPANTLSKEAGDNQSATVGTGVSTLPRVKVSDEFGNGVPGVAVTFAVATGGGSATGTSATTGADGTAAVGGWTLGATAGPNTLTASATGLADLTFTATGVAAPAPAGFDVEVRVIGSMSSAVQAAFSAAEARWEQVITGDLPNVSLTASQTGQCGDAPDEAVLVDDLVIYAKVGPIDGSGGTLGQAGPCWIRTSSSIPIMGSMTFDEADLADMQNNGTLADVILHEMGHVIGIGTVWDNQGLIQGAGTDDPFFSGTNAIGAFQGMGGTVVNGVPVANTGGSGTRDGHWREVTFQNELMTGYISGSNNPLSILTVRSLADQGYTVNTGAADGYALPAPSPVPAAILARPTWERVLLPLGSIDPVGGGS